MSVNLFFFVFVQVEKGRAVCSRCWLCIKMDSGSFSLFFAWTLFTLFWIFLRSFKVVFGCLFSVVFGFSSKFGHCSLFQLFFCCFSSFHVVVRLFSFLSFFTLILVACALLHCHFSVMFQLFSVIAVQFCLLLDLFLFFQVVFRCFCVWVWESAKIVS